jgi:hypothetical protein
VQSADHAPAEGQQAASAIGIAALLLAPPIGVTVAGPSGQRTAMFLNWSKITIRSHGTAGTGLFRPSVAGFEIVRGLI